MSQTELADRIHVTKATISNYENKYSSPSNELLVKIADALEVTTDYLLGRDIITNRSSSVNNSIISELEKYPQMYQDIATDPEKGIELLYRLYQIKLQLTNDKT